MQLITVVLAVFMDLFAVVHADPTFVLYNNCRFPIYVREAVAQHPGPRPGETCKNYGESAEGALSAGGIAYGQFPVPKDSCGHSIKVARTPGGPVYQFEFVWALEDDKIYYDLSHKNGAPFTDVDRELTGPPGCPSVMCMAGNDGSQCDYPAQKDCVTKGVLTGYLCGHPGSKTSQSKPVGIWELPKVGQLA